jgi:hypothetical protein
MGKKSQLGRGEGKQEIADKARKIKADAATGKLKHSSRSESTQKPSRPR